MKNGEGAFNLFFLSGSGKSAIFFSFAQTFYKVMIMQCQDKVWVLTIPFHLQDFFKHDLLHSIFSFDVINLLKKWYFVRHKKFHVIK